MSKIRVEPDLDAPECTITCHCGAVYRGRHAIKTRAGALAIIVDQACPSCGEARPFSARYDPDPSTIRGAKK